MSKYYCTETYCDKQATVGYTWPWGESGAVCDDHATAVKLRGEALNQTPTLTELQPRAEPESPALALATVTTHLEHTGRELEQLRIDHAKEREAHAATGAELERVTAELERVTNAPLATSPFHPGAAATQRENVALKEQLERVTAELERVTTEYARRNAETPTTDRPGHVVEHVVEGAPPK